MARDGEILNTSLLKQLAALLRIGAVKQFPKQLNLDDVKVVVDLVALSQGIAQVPQPGDGLGARFFMDSDELDIATLTSVTINVIGTAGALGLPLPALLGYGYRFDALELEIDMNLAGSTLLNGKTLNLQLKQTGGGDPSVDVDLIADFGLNLFATAKNIYKWALWQSASGANTAAATTWKGGFLCTTTEFVTGGTLDTGNNLYFRLTLQDGTAFPAATVCRVKALVRRTTNGRVPEQL